jgi:hypothetical protein
VLKRTYGFEMGDIRRIIREYRRESPAQQQ